MSLSCGSRAEHAGGITCSYTISWRTEARTDLFVVYRKTGSECDSRAVSDLFLSLLSFFLSFYLLSFLFLLYRQIAENRAQRYKLQWTPAACRIKFKRNNARFFKALHE